VISKTEEMLNKKATLKKGKDYQCKVQENAGKVEIVKKYNCIRKKRGMLVARGAGREGGLREMHVERFLEGKKVYGGTSV